MRQIFYYLFLATIFSLIGWFANTAYHLPRTSNNPIARVRPTPLAKYSVENLSKANIRSSEIVIGKVLKDNPEFTSYEYKMSFSPDLSDNLRVTSGLINIPKGESKFPIVVMFRGYVDPKDYFIGNGTTHAAEFFAQNGFITVAPDFLGYGDSDQGPADLFESRFQTYITAMSTLKSVNSLKDWDTKNVFIWGHSNGGQITLTVLEATGLTYPTSLWAPVSKPFPYSILYYTDDASDSGKFLRSKTAEFENNYDSDLFSLTKYLSLIKAPLQLNQGTNDDAVPVAWTNLLNKNLKEASVSADYIKYPGADHNMNPTWGQAISNSLQFFQKHIQ